MATKQPKKNGYEQVPRNEPITSHPLSKSDPPMHRNLAQTLSDGALPRAWENNYMGEKDTRSIDPSAPSLLNLKSYDDDVDRHSNASGGISMFQPVSRSRTSSLSGCEVEGSETFDIMAKGSWGQAAYNSSTGLEYKWVPRTSENAHNKRTTASSERNRDEAREEKGPHSSASGLLSKVKLENDILERRFLHENLRSNENNVERRNLFQFSPSVNNGTNVRPSSQGVSSAFSNNRAYPQGIDSTFINAKAFNIRTYEQFCRIISGANRKPFEGEMHGGIIYKVSDYLIVRERFLRESNRSVFEECSEEIINPSNCCRCTIS